MHEQLISFETAKLAKEKEFNEYCKYFYTEESGLCVIDDFDGDILTMLNDDLTIKETHYDCNGYFWYNELEDGTFEHYEPVKYIAPTQSLLQKWLREEYKIDIVIGSNYIGYNIILWNRNTNKNIKIEQNLFQYYEEALEQGLQEALKLIK